MTGKLCVVAALTAIVVGITPTLAGSKRHRNHVKPPVYAPESGYSPGGSSFEPPRMIEARPGVWISSYDCITDDGYGRWLPCSASSGKR